MTFNLVYADPPWRYSFSRSRSRRVENQYATMSVDEICALGKAEPLARVEKSAVLFLWATAPKLLESLRVLEQWGFVYKTHAVWDKQRIGMGYWFRGCHELLLVGTRGKPALPPAALRLSSIFVERRRDHSRKPEAVRAWIDRAFPAARKLEMFAREAAPGWSAWGREAPAEARIA